MHMARTKDFSSWEYLGTVFNDQTSPPGRHPARSSGRPTSATSTASTSCTSPSPTPRPTPVAIPRSAWPPPRPRRDRGPPPTARSSPPSRTANGGYFGTIDPALLTAADGKRYLYYGGFYGGISVTELTPDGLHAVGSPTQVTIGDRYEGAYAVYRDGWYYLMGSSTNCCAGPTTGYSVFAGRSAARAARSSTPTALR